MNLNRMGNPLSRDERIKFNENLTLIEGEFKRVSDVLPVADEAKKIADEAKATAAAADSKSDNVQKQLTNIVVNGDSSPQAAQASVSADGTTYPSLKARLDAEQQAAAALLAKKVNEADLEVERQRISVLTAHAGNTDGNAELLDIRVGFDGITYATAGDATRALANYMTTENEPWEVL